MRERLVLLHRIRIRIRIRFKRCVLSVPSSSSPLSAHCAPSQVVISACHSRCTSKSSSVMRRYSTGLGKWVTEHPSSAVQRSINGTCAEVRRCGAGLSLTLKGELEGTTRTWGALASDGAHGLLHVHHLAAPHGWHACTQSNFMPVCDISLYWSRHTLYLVMWCSMVVCLAVHMSWSDFRFGLSDIPLAGC